MTANRSILLVEGKDEEIVFERLLQSHSRNRNFSFTEPAKPNSGGGIERVIEQIPVYFKSGYDRIGVVVDADEDLGSRWDSLAGKIRNLRFDVPPTPGEFGTVIDGYNDDLPVRFGVWLMPNNRLPGMLESFLEFLVPADDNLLKHVDRFIDGIPIAERRFGPRLAKARIHAYLSIQEHPGKPLGLAIASKYLDARAEIVNQLLAWVDRVFVDPLMPFPSANNPA